jgi:hypothetical protein
MEKSERPNWKKWMKSVTVAVFKKPGLMFPAIYQVYVLAPRRWYAKYPFLPLPDSSWMRFRMETAYGNPSYVPDPEEISQFLTWARVR